MKKRTLVRLVVTLTDASTVVIEGFPNKASEVYANYLNGRGFNYNGGDYPYHSIFSVHASFQYPEEDAPTDTFCTPEN